MATKTTKTKNIAVKEKSAKAADLEATIYNSSGKAAGSMKLPSGIFGLKWNPDLVHQVVTAMQANARSPWAHAKDRSEVRGGGKKPWKQKGTGRARHGSSRSPIWRKGGVTHGPRKAKDYSQKINRKVRVKALYTTLSKRYADGRILFVSDLAFKEPKTKDARKTLTTLGSISGYQSLADRRKNALYLVLPEGNANVKKSFQNMGNVLVGTASTMNPVDVLSYQYLAIVAPEQSMKVIEARSN